MPKLLIIGTEHRDDINDIADALNKKSQDNCVSFYVMAKENMLQLVGGHAPNYIKKCLPLPENHQLKKGKFSLDGSYFKQLLPYTTEVKKIIANGNIKYLKHEKPIVLELHSDNGRYPLIGLRTEQDQWRSCKSGPIFAAHDDFIKAIQQHPYQNARVPEILGMLLEVNNYVPFQYIDIDKETKDIRVQSDNNQTLHAIPEGVPVPLSLALTYDAALSLKKTCEKTKDDTIDISVHGENITIKTSETTMTQSLAGLEEFYKKKPKKYREIASMVVDISRFKGEIEEFHDKYDKIRRADQSYLLIEPTQLYIANIVGGYGFGSAIYTKGINITESQLYLLHLKDIRAIKIKDLTTSAELKIAILKGPQGEYKLGFYKDGNFKYAYDSVAIEAAPEALEEIMAVKKKDQESKAAKCIKPDDEPQEDMFGFEDI